MRIFLVLLMLTLLPLPFSAAASVVCSHHGAAQPSPHAIPHLLTQVQPADAAQVVLTVTSGHDFECGTCHSHGAGVMATRLEVMANLAGAMQVEHRNALMKQHGNEPPYRPNWPTPDGSGLRALT